MHAACTVNDAPPKLSPISAKSACQYGKCRTVRDMDCVEKQSAVLDGLRRTVYDMVHVDEVSACLPRPCLKTLAPVPKLDTRVTGRVGDGGGLLCGICRKVKYITYFDEDFFLPCEIALKGRVLTTSLFHLFAETFVFA